MLRQLLMFKGIFLSNDDFNKVMKDTEDDIKFNRIGFNKRTSLKEVIKIAVISSKALKRCI